MERTPHIPPANTNVQCVCLVCLGGMTSVQRDRKRVWGLCVQLWEVCKGEEARTS